METLKVIILLIVTHPGSLLYLIYVFSGYELFNIPADVVYKKCTLTSVLRKEVQMFNKNVHAINTRMVTRSKSSL